MAQDLKIEAKQALVKCRMCGHFPTLKLLVGAHIDYIAGETLKSVTVDRFITAVKERCGYSADEWDEDGVVIEMFSELKDMIESERNGGT